MENARATVSAVLSSSGNASSEAFSVMRAKVPFEQCSNGRRTASLLVDTHWCAGYVSVLPQRRSRAGTVGTAREFHSRGQGSDPPRLHSCPFFDCDPHLRVVAPRRTGH